MSRKLTDLQLERFLADAMSPAERAQVDAALGRSPEDAEALRLMKADTEALMVQLPPAAFVEKVMPTKPGSRAFGAWWAALATFAAVVVAVVVWRSSPDEDDLRVKGSVGWKVLASGKGAVRTLAPRDAIVPGETLSFQVTSAEPRYVAVLSHAPDGWFVYAPAVRIESGQSVLQTAALLDETVGDETLFLASSEAPFDADAVKEALSQGAATVVTIEPLPLLKRR